MALIGKVFRMRHREKKLVRAIVKATSLARNTFRKYLRLGKAEAPQYGRPEAPGKLAPFVEAMQQALLADARKPKEERGKAKAPHAQLAEAGSEGGVTWSLWMGPGAQLSGGPPSSATKSYVSPR